jgi:geranylgeranyl diphosphate synthase type I
MVTPTSELGAGPQVGEQVAQAGERAARGRQPIDLAAQLEPARRQRALGVDRAPGQVRGGGTVADERDVGAGSSRVGFDPAASAVEDDHVARHHGVIGDGRRDDLLGDRDRIRRESHPESRIRAERGIECPQPVGRQEAQHPGSVMVGAIPVGADDGRRGRSAAYPFEMGASTAGAIFPPALSDIAERTEARVDAILAAEVDRWSAVDAGLEAPLNALRDLVMAGGKRLRPAFCYSAFIGAGGASEDPLVVDVGAALELLHTFALVHDDVMDGSDTRRGHDAVHQRFIRAHRDGGWRGEPRRFGEGIAILVGDFACTYADLLMRGAPAPALDVYDELRVELCVGQSLDLVGTALRSADVEDARRIATYKSAKYTVERPLHLGAALAGRVDDLREPLSAIGLPLGEAFQLRDDLLGVFGEERVTGKPVGDDLREGKTTPLLAIATSRADSDGRELLRRVGAGDLEDTEVKALQELFLASGAVDEVEATIDTLVIRAQRALAAAPLTTTARELLEELAIYVAWRDH